MFPQKVFHSSSFPISYWFIDEKYRIWTCDDLRDFEAKSSTAFEDIKASFDFFLISYSGVYILTYEADSASKEIALH